MRWTFLVIMMVVRLPANGQETSTNAPAASLKTVAELTAAEVQRRRTRSASAQGLTDTQRQTASKLYDQALTELQSADAYVKQVEQWKKLRQTAAKETELLANDLATATDNRPFRPTPDATVAQLEQALASARQKLDEEKKAVQDLEQELARRADRRPVVAELLEETRTELRKLTGSSANPIEPGTSPEPAIAQQTLNEARQRTVRAEISMLEQELPTYDATAELLDLQRRLAARRVEQAEAVRHEINEAVEQLRREVAQQQADAARLATMRADPRLRPVADENLRLSRLRTGTPDKREEGLAARINRATDQLEQFDAQLKVLNVMESELDGREELEGISEYLGPWLVEQLSELPRVSNLRREIYERQAVIGRVRLKMTEFRGIMADSENIASRVDGLLEEISSQTTPREQYALRQTADQLVREQAALVNDLAADYSTLFGRLNDLSARQQALSNDAAELQARLEKDLLWLRASEVIRWHHLSSAREASIWLTRWDAWRRYERDVRFALLDSPLLSGLYVLVIAGLLVVRESLRRRLRELGRSAARSYLTPFRTTGTALGITILLSLVWPAMMWGAGGLTFRFLGAANFSRAVGVGLMATGAFCLLLEVMRRVCALDGLAQSHFRWDHRRVSLIRGQLRHLMALALPFVFLYATIAWDGQLVFQESLGRLLFIVVHLLMAFALFRMMGRLKPTAEGVPIVSRTWRARVGTGLLVGGPMLIAGLSSIGYHFTATQLSLRFVATLALTECVLVLQGVTLRWLCYVRGSLAIQQARQRRDACEESRDSSDPERMAPDREWENEVDLGTVIRQTRRLMHASVRVALFLGLWLIWLDVLPGNSLLEFQLTDSGQRTVAQMSEGGTPSSAQPLSERQKAESLTIADVVLVILVAMAAISAARNIPGLVEVSIPKDAPLDGGARYAVGMLVRYGIVATGLVVVFSIIGIGWSKVQWLVAALSVGVGFGLQELVANFISGLILLFDRPVRVGDIVTVDDITGVVTRVQIRATTIRNWDRKEYIVPNKDLITGRVLNWTLSNTVNRVVIPVGIAYGSDTRKARSILTGVLDENPSILADPAPTVTLEQFGDSTLNFVLRAFLSSLDDRMETIHQLHAEIHDRLAKAGIDIAFPQLEVRLMPNSPSD